MNELVFSDRFMAMVEKVYEKNPYNTVAKWIINKEGLNSSQMNYVDWTETGYLSYMPSHRVQWEPTEDQLKATNFNHRARQMCRPGKGLRSLFDAFLMNSTIERFVDAMDTEMVLSTCDFEVVSGEDIRYWYSGKNYDSVSDTGSLRSSCMRYDNCQPFFDMYVNNPDKIRMLIVKNKGSDYIIARALIWTADSGDTLVDRIYGRVSVIEAVKAWARENGYWHKQQQTYDSERAWVTPDGQYVNKSFVVTLKSEVLIRYPYLDTFQFLSFKKVGHEYQMVASNYFRQRKGEQTFGAQEVNGGPFLTFCDGCECVIHSCDSMCRECRVARQCRYCYTFVDAGVTLIGGECPTCNERNRCNGCGQMHPAGVVRFRSSGYRVCPTCNMTLMQTNP